jgi:Sap, sulfolipid-1-addressing protein
MDHAIARSLALAIGVAFSPVPITAVVLMLTTAHAKVNGLAFVLGWLFSLGIIGTIVLCISGPAGARGSDELRTSVSWLEIALGTLLFLVAIHQFRRHPRAQKQVPMLKGTGTVSNFSARVAFVSGALLVGANPKNLLLAVAGATAVAQTGIAGAQQAIAYLSFAVIAAIGVGAPVLIYLAMGRRSQDLFARLQAYIGRHRAVITSVLCLIVSATLIGEAITGLTE